MSNKRVLYLSWDGMTDPLGQSQVLSYLIKLSKFGYTFDLISLDKKDQLAAKRDKINKLIEGTNINWYPLEFESGRPILSSYANLEKEWKQILALRAQGIKHDILHCRNPICSILGRRYKNKFGGKFLFDMRGWFADEKRESGLWGSPIFIPVFKFLKHKERQVFEDCDINISLTHVGKKFIVESGLKEENKVEVIPTCVNFETFKPFSQTIRDEVREELNLPANSTVMLYSGSLGGNYRIDLVLKFFKELVKLKEVSHFIFLTHSDHKFAHDAIKEVGLSEDKFRIVSSSFQDVHRYLMAGDIGVIMYNTDFSVIGRSPTKLGEYWACGLPLISAKGIGDLEFIVEKYPGSGALISSLDAHNEYKEAVSSVLTHSASKDQLRKYSLDYYDIEKGIISYKNIYEKLSN